MTAPMTADELRDLAARTYRTCIERQARIAATARALDLRLPAR